ncbi:nitrite/sulfite reductase [Floccifex sp.]|uniref:nitrite/sulfite reductase n=1 Tax=Floccifex sp. TaxID=2815810 RepID=UPI003F070E89
MNNLEFKKDLPEFIEKTNQFYSGEMNMKDYKGFSGFYGSYAQKGGKASMLRLRLPAGVITKETLNFIVNEIKKYEVTRAHFTTCQTIQLHDLQPSQLFSIYEDILDFGIISIGGGGDFPRNVMCSPLSGVQKDEYFDVTPYAQAVSNYLLTLVKAEKMPRKLKVGFSNTKDNVTHATFRDLGFVACQDGTFDVYCCGGLGNNPRFGVQVASKVQGEDLLYYVKAMRDTFLQHGNYTNRAKARTRYMIEAVGGEQAFKEYFNENLKEAFKEDLKINVSPIVITKQGNGSIEGFNVIAQKQEGLYSVCYHPLGGNPSLEVLAHLNDALQDMDDVILRLSPDESCYITNLTAQEARIVLDVIKEDSAQNVFETSISCIGASTCQVGLRDSQGLLKTCIEEIRNANLPADALCQIHISGCPSSCGTHQVGKIGFRGHTKVIDKKAYPAFMLYIAGNDMQGSEAMGKEMGAILEEDVPKFLVELGTTIASSHCSFDEWVQSNPNGIEQIASKYI